MGKYREIVANFAQKYGLKVYNIDEDTFRLCGKYNLLQVFFRENQYEFQYWGAFIEDVGHDFCDDDFDKRLSFAVTKFKMVYGLNEAKQIICEKICNINENIEDIKLSKKGLKYFLEVSFLNEPKFYIKNKNSVSIQKFERSMPCMKIFELLKNKLDVCWSVSLFDSLECVPDIKINLNNDKFGTINSDLWGENIYLHQQKQNITRKFPLSQYSLQQIADEIIKIVNEHKQMIG